MAANIIVEASDVWGYFMSHKETLESQMKLIAENEAYGIEIYLSAIDDLATITVLADDEEVYEEQAGNVADCRTVVNEVYDTYLSSNALNALTDGWLSKNDEELDAAEEMDDIEERELELDEAVYGLMDAFVPNLFDVEDDPDDVYEGLKDCICEYLYKRHGISVYRPMYLEDDDGSDFFTEYPYPEIDFDDED